MGDMNILKRAAASALSLTLAVGISLAGSLPAQAEPGDVILPDGSFLTALAGGNTVGGNLREAEPRADGYRHIDTPAMIERLEQLNVTMFSFGIWDSPTDWDDLVNEFAPAAEDAGIDVMVYLVPPSECQDSDVPHLSGRCSRPFESDYIGWVEAIAELSLVHPNVKSWGIDDFLAADVNTVLFTPAYLQAIRDAQDAINPDLKWYVTVYFGEINPTSLAKLSGITDGIIYAYNSVQSTADSLVLEQYLDAALALTGPAGQELVLLVYNGRFLDGNVHPDERYAADMFRRAEPYLADGRISGIVAYGAPIDYEQQAPSADYHALVGYGSLSLSVSNFVGTAAGNFAMASQTIEVDAAAETKTLMFQHADQDEGHAGGYHFLQVLVDGQVVWERDTALDPRDTWLPEIVDLTAALDGKSDAELSFQLLEKNGVGWYPIDIRLDDLAAEGFTITDPGFETDTAWESSRNTDHLQSYIDIYSPSRPALTFNAISEAFAHYQGRTSTPVPTGDWSGLTLSPENRAMYGNGRLLFTVERNTPVPAGACASAWQDAAVDPDSPRYQIDFWHQDPHMAKWGGYHKQILIDGEIVWADDIGDYWPWFYMQGAVLQGPVDITEFVQGKSSVKVEFKLCADIDLTNFSVEYNVDNLSMIGVDLDNGGFEDGSAWTLETSVPEADLAASAFLPAPSAEGPISVRIAIVEPPADPGGPGSPGSSPAGLAATGSTPGPIGLIGAVIVLLGLGAYVATRRRAPASRG